MIFNMSGGGVNTGIQLVAIENASSLPEAAHESTVYVLTSQRIADIYVQVEKPESTTDGAAWVVIDSVNPDKTILMSDNFTLPIRAVRLYDAARGNWFAANFYVFSGGEWTYVEGCICLFDGVEWHNTVTTTLQNKTTSTQEQEYLVLKPNGQSNVRTNRFLAVSTLERDRFYNSVVEILNTSPTSSIAAIDFRVSSLETGLVFTEADVWHSVCCEKHLTSSQTQTRLSIANCYGDLYLKGWYVYR